MNRPTVLVALALTSTWGACTVTVPFASGPADGAMADAFAPADVTDAPTATLDGDPGAVWTLYPPRTDSALRSVRGRSASDVWAVGEEGVALHWDGATWTSLPTGTTGGLRGVWGLVDVWAVGAKDDGTALILRWNSGAWTVDTTITDAYPLRAVWGSSSTDVWAAGGSVEAGLDEVLHWNGSQWQRVSMGGQFTEYLGLDGDASNDAVLVTSDDSLDQWDGAWHNGDERPGAGTLTGGVWIERPGSVWLTGTDGAVLRLRDGVWSDPIVTGALGTLHALCGTSASDVWAVGEGGTIVHWDGAAWARVPPLTAATLWSIACIAPDVAWAVGEHGTMLRLAP